MPCQLYTFCPDWQIIIVESSAMPEKKENGKMQETGTVKGPDAIKEIAAILAAGIIRMKQKGKLK